MTILDKIKKNAEEYPDRCAIMNYCAVGGVSLSWHELDVFSDKLAVYLHNRLKTNTPIIVYGHKHPYMIVCFLACAKSGRAYCPIDINVPLSRTEAIINEVQPEIILCTELLDINTDILLPLDDIDHVVNSHNSIIPINNMKPDDVFYIIFTSGSTGIPKGVQITLDCLDNFIKWAITLGTAYNEDEHYTFINQAPFSFDLSVMDLYLSLYIGGTLWCLTKKFN